MHPKEFVVNEAWIALKATEAPIRVEHDLVDVFVLMDAASMYMFATRMASLGTGSPSIKDASAMLQAGWKKKHEWPKTVVLPDTLPSDNTFAVAARKKGLPVRVVPESDLAVYVEDVRQAFHEHFGPGTRGDA